MKKQVSALLELMDASEIKKAVYILVLFVGLAFLESIGIASIMPFLTILSDPSQIQQNDYLFALFLWLNQFDITTADEFLIFLGFLTFAIVCSTSVYKIAAQHAMNGFMEDMRIRISCRLFEAYLKQPYGYFITKHSAEMTKTMLSEVDQLLGNVFRPVLTMFSSTFLLITLVSFLIWLNPLVAFLAFVVLGLIYFFIYIALRSLLKRIGETVVEANEERFTTAGEVFGGIKDVKLFGHEEIFIQRFVSPSQRFAAAQTIYASLSTLPKHAVEAIAFGGIILLITFLLLGDTNNGLSDILPLVGVYGFTAYRLQPALQAIFSGSVALRYGAKILHNLRTVLNLDIPEGKHKGVGKFKLCDSIEFKAVCFKYPDSSDLALDSVSIKIPVGSCVGIVGRSGSGKSTFVDLLLGLLAPSSGSVLIDGKQLRSENLRDWQKTIGYVPQHIFVGDTTVIENIAFGEPADEIDINRASECARIAQIDELMGSRSSGHSNKSVGERGIGLSGGQRQRIGIARALYRDPQILVFDEATSALDTATEKQVITAIEGFRNSKTLIMVAHRISTLKHCDFIMCFDGGRLDQICSYEEARRKTVS